MYILIERYINKLTIKDINSFALNNNINLNEEELSFVYNFIKKNWQTILNNHGYIDLSKYKEKFSEENFSKIQLLLKEYINKYRDYL